MRNFLRAVFLIFAATVLGGQPAQAQDTEIYGAYCGRVTWSGRAPVDTWLIFLRGNRYQTPISVGALVEARSGTYVQDGAALTLRSNDPPFFVMTTIVGDGRISGTITNDRGEQGVISLTQMRGTGGGLRSSPLPPDFSLPGAQGVLAGDWRSVQQVVTWAWSAQGSDYWRTIYNAGPPLPEDARAAIEDWIRRDAAGEQPRCGY